MATNNIDEYIKEINEIWLRGGWTEYSFRSALQKLMTETLGGKMIVEHEPGMTACGKPDYIIERKSDELPVAFVETKTPGDSDLDGRKEHKEQFDRYKGALEHVVFTDYLDFRFYEGGELKDAVRIGEVSGGKIVKTGNGEKWTGLIKTMTEAEPRKTCSATTLAKIMAGKARLLRDAIIEIRDIENEEEEEEKLASQYRAIRDYLIHDLKWKGFADIYAQTIVYGMFAARLNDKTPDTFSRQEAAELIPGTNPLLQNIFRSIVGYDVDKRIEWILDDLANTFKATDLGKIMGVYGQSGQERDPMVHFYEDFLTEYDPQLRKKMGVWYTPPSVVRFIVRSVDEILTKVFGLKGGLANEERTTTDIAVEQSKDNKSKDGLKHIQREIPKVQILDPATGTGTFLAETVLRIHDKFKGMEGMWPQWVDEQLLPRLNGFELLMAPYSIAHLKLGMMLEATGYKASGKRLKIYLTNSLEEGHSQQRNLWAQWLNEESERANEVKSKTPVMVVIGNPPYNVSSCNKGKWITDLIAVYKRGLNERNIQPLSDDYIKFIRSGQNFIDKNNEGVLAMITNNTFIDGIIHRQMRRSLLESFSDIYILNLHGNAKKKEKCPDGSKDDNVFNIQQGVSINIFIKREKKQGDLGKVHYATLQGLKTKKFDYLDNNSIESVEWEDIEYTEPNYFFVPKNFEGQEEYERGFKVDVMMRIYNSGLQAQRDSACISIDEANTRKLLSDYLTLSIDEIRHKYNFEDTRDWTIENAKNDIINNTHSIEKILYRPFDVRICIYTGKTKGIMGYPRYEIMKHIIRGKNYAVILNRTTKTPEYNHVYITTNLLDKHILETANSTANLFPLYLYPDDGGERVVNLDKGIWKKIDEAVVRETTELEVFDYIYGVLHEKEYRERYKEFLKIDFPRVPYPKDAEEFEKEVKRGEELRKLHLMEGEEDWETTVGYPATGTNEVADIKRDGEKVWINSEQYFEGVSEEAWEFYIGGYQPMQKWLKDRRGRTLTLDDIRHYMRMEHAIRRTAEIVGQREGYKGDV